MALELEIEFDWTEKLIQAIQARPAIYNKNLKEHTDKNAIVKSWLEVCEIMITSWNDLTIPEKQIKGKELQQKWRNLRTCFLRELNKQKQTKTKQAGHKRRKYIYFDQLLFLLPTISESETISESKFPPQNEKNKINSENEIHESNQNQSIKSEIETKYKNTKNVISKPRSEHYRSSQKNVNVKKRKISYEDTLLEILKEKKTKKIDEDKYFLLSLVPSFKKMTDENKINAKILILGVLKNINENSVNESEITVNASNPKKQNTINVPSYNVSYSDNSSQSWLKTELNSSYSSCSDIN